MKLNIRGFFKRDFLINQLMQIYSFLLVLISILIMLVLSVYSGAERFRNSDRLMNMTSIQLENYIRNKDSLVTSILGELTGTDRQFDSLRNYLHMDAANYFEYSNNIFRKTGESVFLPDKVYRLIATHSEIEELIIQLDESNSYLKATRKSPLGEIVQGNPASLSDSLYFARPISAPSNYAKSVGQIFVIFDKNNVLGNLAEDNHQAGIDSFIFSNSGQRLFNSPGISTELLKHIDHSMMTDRKAAEKLLAEKFYVTKRQTYNDMVTLVLLNKRVIWTSILSYTGVIFLCGTLIIVLLLVVLNRTFKRYTYQVENIVTMTQKVSQGNFKEQIDTTQVQQELKEIAEAINQMTVSINDYIEDIYTLEIKQRDAHMRALQSQINPHFLYNTLEYIRMYALSCEQEELADVVYAFSALLRNNTTQEKTTTLQQEVDFCEKYVYLYQMRYPDKIAYHVQLDERLKGLVIPKFTIQPLIENYFVHGIDYQRQDNAISIKAFLKNDKIWIQLTDNGRGIEPEKLQQIRYNLAEIFVEPQTSIGLKNVHERLRGAYGDKYQMIVDSDLWKGVQISIVLDKEVLEHDNL